MTPEERNYIDYRKQLAYSVAALCWARAGKEVPTAEAALDAFNEDVKTQIKLIRDYL